MGKKNPFAAPRTPPVVAPAPVCKLGERCHVNGKGLRTFGTKFPLATVQKLASCSIQLSTNNVNNPSAPDMRVASGVLLTSQVAIFASHSINQGIGTLKVLMDFECDTATAPPGMKSQYGGSPWPACTTLASSSQAVEVKTLEQSDSSEFDYAIVLIKWNTVSSANTVSLPRKPDFPKAAFVFTDEMLLIGHPDDSSNQGEPTQGCAFKVINTKGPNPQTGKGDEFGYGEFNFSNGSGFSGGGVFNDRGELVGLLKGSPGNTISGLKPNNFAFLNLGLAEGKTRNDPRRGRLTRWFTTGDPLKPGEGSSNPPTFV